MTHNISRKHRARHGASFGEDRSSLSWIASLYKNQNKPSVKKPHPLPLSKSPEAKAPEPQLTPQEERCCDMATD